MLNLAIWKIVIKLEVTPIYSKYFLDAGTIELVPSVTYDLFWGCIRVVRVSDSNGDLTTLSFSQASESSNMVLSSCTL